jgi:hypothetical protein
MEVMGLILFLCGLEHWLPFSLIGMEKVCLVEVQDPLCKIYVVLLDISFSLFFSGPKEI